MEKEGEGDKENGLMGCERRDWLLRTLYTACACVAFSSQKVTWRASLSLLSLSSLIAPSLLSTCPCFTPTS